VRLLAQIAKRDMRLAALRGAARERTASSVASAEWRALDAALAPLAGDSALRGMATRIRARIAELPESEERALLAAALLNLAPGLIQCLPALTHRYAGFLAQAPASAGPPSPLLTSGGMPDSCFMWRTGGAAARTRLG
jgi:hypothetical protein